jgi:hypothetical protein
VAARRPVLESTRTCFFSLEPLSPECLALYRAVHEDRLNLFPDHTDPEFFRVAIDGEAPEDRRNFAHKLRHDGESIFWLLVWWFLLAQGPGATAPTTIFDGSWRNFTRTDADRRQVEIIPEMLDPAYAGIFPLLEGLGNVLTSGDLHYARAPPFTHDEFLHESFQRIILNFIVKHQGDEFMCLRKHQSPRMGSRSSNTVPPYASSIEAYRAATL